MKYTGSVIKYGDNVDTDVIIPARYLNTSDHKELASHCMEDIDKTFVSRVQTGAAVGEQVLAVNPEFTCAGSVQSSDHIKESGFSE